MLKSTTQVPFLIFPTFTQSLFSNFSICFAHFTGDIGVGSPDLSDRWRRQLVYSIELCVMSKQKTPTTQVIEAFRKGYGSPSIIP